VTAAAATTQLPLDGYSISFSYWPAGTDMPERDRPNGDFRSVTPGYFEAIGIPLRQGRTFTRMDGPGAPAVIVIDESLARAHFGQGNPVGKRMHISYGPGDIAREIVGVVGDVRQRALDVAAQPGYYVPVAQVPWSTMRVIVRTELDPVSLRDVVRREAAAIDPLIAVRGITTLDDRFDASVGPQRFTMLLLGAFAALAVLLATAGVYSVMSHLVAQLTRDIGVQMALGAKASAVRRSVAWRALRVAAAGTALGLVIAAVVTPRISELLFQVSARDPLAFAIAPLLFLAVAWIGSYLPARRASNVDPVVALRAD
jgi:predicted permease